MPGCPLGNPAVTPIRSPALTQPSSTTRRDASAISSSVTPWGSIDEAVTPHMSEARRTTSSSGEST